MMFFETGAVVLDMNSKWQRLYWTTVLSETFTGLWEIYITIQNNSKMGKKPSNEGHKNVKDEPELGDPSTSECSFHITGDG